MKIGITGRNGNALARETARKAMRLLEEKGVKVEIDKNFLSGKNDSKNPKPLKKFRSGLVLSFGGDGTLLLTFHELRRKVLVMGINCGNKGFLQAYNHGEIEEAIEAIVKKKFVAEERTRITARIDGRKVGEALNEVVIVPSKAGRILHYTLKIGKVERKEAGDGMIVATPTGSTAHALSAGGPIVKGNAAVFVVVSMNPVDWKHRPLIINDHEKVVVSSFEKMGAQAILDGQKWFPIRKKIELVKGSRVLLASRNAQ